MGSALVGREPTYQASSQLASRCVGHWLPGMHVAAAAYLSPLNILVAGAQAIQSIKHFCNAWSDQCLQLLQRALSSLKCFVLAGSTVI